MNRIIERLFIEAADKDNTDDYDKDDKGGAKSSWSGDSSGVSPSEEPNRGMLIINTTCTPTTIVVFHDKQKEMPDTRTHPD